ncbi:unnamed protein product [Cercospora beticola]|nr:unnamed protein product [Cercospora beticola]
MRKTGPCGMGYGDCSEQYPYSIPAITVLEQRPNGSMPMNPSPERSRRPSIDGGPRTRPRRIADTREYQTPAAMPKRPARCCRPEYLTYLFESGIGCRRLASTTHITGGSTVITA